MLVADVLLTMG